MLTESSLTPKVHPNAYPTPWMREGEEPGEALGEPLGEGERMAVEEGDAAGDARGGTTGELALGEGMTGRGEAAAVGRTAEGCNVATRVVNKGKGERRRGRGVQIQVSYCWQGHECRAGFWGRDDRAG